MSTTTFTITTAGTHSCAYLQAVARVLRRVINDTSAEALVASNIVPASS